MMWLQLPNPQENLASQQNVCHFSGLEGPGRDEFNADKLVHR
jgi:hypothetical protein